MEGRVSDTGAWGLQDSDLNSKSCQSSKLFLAVPVRSERYF